MRTDHSRSSAGFPLAEIGLIALCVLIPMTLVVVVPALSSIYQMWVETHAAESSARESWKDEEEYNNHADSIRDFKPAQLP